MKADSKLPLINRKKCAVCGLCVEECLQEVLSIVNGRLIYANPEACTYCGTCEMICPESAIRLEYEIRWA